MKLEVQNVEKSFNEKKVLNGISFSAGSGRALGLLGRNGAGKTTTMRIVMDVFPADSGVVLTDGNTPDYSKLRIGYLPEERGLYPRKIILNQLVYFSELKGMSKKDAVVAVDYWLKRLGMEEYRNKRLDTLSKGNQQKIQLITAVAANPDIIILDEPFSGLDPVNAMLLKDVVRELIAKGKIVLFSSHQMNYIEEFCDDIVIINGGEVVLSGGLKNIMRNYPRDKVVVHSPENQRMAASLTEEFILEGDTLTITMKNADDKMALMRRLSESFDIDEMRVYEPSLNDIFVAYTKDKI